MMSNNTYANSSTPSLAKAEELQKFENSFFPAGGAPQLANILQAPPAPQATYLKSNPIHLKTRNWGPKLDNGFEGLDRTLLNNNNNVTSFPSSSTSSTTSTSRSLVDNIPPCPGVYNARDLHNNLIHGKRLRLRNWGYPAAEGWTGMHRDLYSHGMVLERDVLLNELRYKYGPRPNFQQQERSINTNVTNLVETVPTTTTMIATGPAKVLATTVPVPMLNPPINDGRRYAKLYKKNTNALASDKGVSRLVKRRGTRRDHLVQPNVAALPITTLVTPYAGATVIQPATLVAETRSILPTTATGVLPVVATPLAPTKAEMKREKRALKDQQRFVKKEQRASRKANKKNGGNLAQPIITAPILTTPLTTTTLVSSPALPLAAPVTFVGETRSVLTQEATFLAPTTTTSVVPLPLGGVSAQPLDHAHVLAGQLGNAPVKRPRRARKAKKGTEQPLYSNIISATPAPVTATTTIATPITTASSFVEGTVVQPATLVSETVEKS